MVLTRRVVLAAIACGGAVLGACTTDTEVTTAPGSQTALVATTSIWADITSQVTCGEAVSALIPTGADPHTFEPALRDRELLDDASVVIANGGGLEGSVSDLLDTVQQSGTDVIDMTEQVDTVDGDPHIWQDPTLVAATIETIADAAVASGGDPATIASCVAGYRAELTALDAEISSMIDTIPPEHRVMVTSHDSLEYFARRYGLEIVGTVIPSTNTLAETSAAQLADLTAVIAERNVAAVFTEQLESANDAEALANRLGVGVVPLVTDALTADAPGDTYIDMMRSNATAIAEALTP
jgi:zinc/manganese transport system substrate-binding protein